MQQVECKEGSLHIIKSFVKLQKDQSTMSLLKPVCFKWLVKNGETVYFWEDYWMEGGPLMNQFSRLYRISETKHSSVKDFLEAASLNISREVLWCRPIINRDKEQIQLLKQSLEKVSLTDGLDT